MKPIIVTPKRLLLFGIPALAIFLFYAIGFSVATDALRKKNARLSKTFEEVRELEDRLSKTTEFYQSIIAHQIVVKGQVVKSFAPDEKQFFVTLKNPVLGREYRCVFDNDATTRKKLLDYTYEVENGTANILVLAGFILKDHFTKASVIPLINCFVISSGMSPHFQ